MDKPHFRKCWQCGNVGIHGDSITPHVLCTICGSQDTRRFSRPPYPETSNEAEKLTKLYMTHPIVHEAIRRGATPQQVILLLAAEIDKLHQQVVNIQDDREHLRGIQ